MRERRPRGRRGGSGAAGLIRATAIGQRLWTIIRRRPVDTVAVVGAAAASLTIVVNAIWLQSEPRPAPFVANPASTRQTAEYQAGAAATRQAEPASGRPGFLQRSAQAASIRRNDPIAELISTSSNAPSPQVMAVQRVLSAYGYGQIKPSGIVDQPTNAAIEKFQSEHKMPVTGRISDQLLSELAAMTGRPVE